MSATGWRIVTWAAAGAAVLAIGVPVARAIGWQRTVRLAKRIGPAVAGAVRLRR